MDTVLKYLMCILSSGVWCMVEKGFLAHEVMAQNLRVLRATNPVSSGIFIWVSLPLLFFPQALQAENIQGLKSGVVKITARVEGQSKVGTGIVIRQEKNSVFIVTASHVIEGDPHPTIQFYSHQNRPVQGKVLAMEGGDPRGLAILTVKGKVPETVKVLTLNPQLPLDSGAPVTTIGFPRLAGAPWAVTKGELVGRKGRDLVFSGAIDEGNSGGPLLKDHVIVGIVTESSPPFAYGAPAVLVQYVLESWGVRFGVRLRAKPATISLVHLNDMIQGKGFHHPFDGRSQSLPGARLGTFEHTYELQVHEGNHVVVDHATGLMWQQGGSKSPLRFGIIDQEPWEYVKALNSKAFGGFSDWRLPTVEELASLMESIGTNEGLFLDPMFDPTQRQCWTSDQLIKQEDEKRKFLVGPWEVLVDFERGRIFHRLMKEGSFAKAHVRAVRSLKEEASSEGS